MTGVMLSLQADFGPTAAPPSGTVLFSSSVIGPWSWKSTVNVSVTVEGWGGGGPGSAGVLIDYPYFVPLEGGGGGGGGYFSKATTPSIGTVLAGVIGGPGSYTGPTNGAATTYVGGGCTANGGAFSPGFLIGGAGGTASGGTTNTTGTAGSTINAWDGGGAPNGGANQLIVNGAGNTPGGGSAGAEPPVPPLAPATGQITIKVT